MIKTAKIKIRPESYTWLNKAAKEVNSVWNYCRWVSEKSLRDRAKPLSAFDLINLTSGVTKADREMRVGQATVSKVAAEYAIRRKQFKKLKLRYRDEKKSLGWIPVKPEQISKRKGNGFTYNGKKIRLFEDLPETKLAEGSFAQDSVGDWYLCVPYQFKPEASLPEKDAVGIDLGLKTVATCSDGTKLEHRFYREAEKKLGLLQKRGHKKQAKLLHRKIKNRRANAVHNFTTNLVRKYNQIYIGDLSFKFLKGGKKAKSAYDGAIGMLKTQLEYKGQQAARWVKFISEKYTTQACSTCGSLSGPAGWTGLVERDWLCVDCGSMHDRDINSAVNILNLGMKYHPPFAGTSQTCDFEKKIMCQV
jgi:transposase